MAMPVSLAHMVNTLRSDVDAAHDKVRHELFEAARLRVAADHTAYDILDELKSTIAARFLAWYRDGQFKKALEDIGQASAPVEASKVQFPTSQTPTSGT